LPADFIIKTGDMIQITIFPPAIVPMLMSPVPLVGTSSSMQVNMMLVCLEGDELPPALKVPMPYTAPPFVTPGMGTVAVTINPTNKTATTKNDNKLILIKGTPFVAEFTVTAPAMQPTPGGPVPDPVAKKPGMAQFITTNVTVKAG
jgi:contractile injection system spike tip protein